MSSIPPPPSGRFAQLPQSLRERSRTLRLGDNVPALFAHPDGESPAPVVIWMHGRTVNKELDPGRYLRWIRAGIAAVALDLPGHGERNDPDRQTPRGTPGVLGQMLEELDAVLDDLTGGELAPLLRADRIAIGGMSAGGMVTLRRLCDPHPFIAAAVESTSGDLGGLYFPDSATGPSGEDDRTRAWPAKHDPEEIAPIDPAQHLDGWRPIPLLALHSEADQMIPWSIQARFLDKLAARYAELGESPARIERVTWASTGAPAEHAGFGKVAAEAKDKQLAFLKRELLDPSG